MFWLSHHHPDEHQRTYVLAGVRVCARCLGVYPVMFAGIAAQVATGASTAWRLDPAWAIGLLLPALGDWVRGRFRPQAGSNAFRTATGVLLGLALARTLYVHLREPLPALLLVQGALVTAVAVPVMFLTWRRGTK